MDMDIIHTACFSLYPPRLSSSSFACLGKNNEGFVICSACA